MSSADFVNGLDTCLIEKVRPQTGPDPGTWVKTWEADPAEFGPTNYATFVLTNIGVVPWDTELTGELTLKFGFKHTVNHGGPKLQPPEAEFPRMPLPDAYLHNYLLYGITQGKPYSPMSALPAMTVNVFDLDDPHPDADTKTYAIAPFDKQPITAGYTGPLFGSVAMTDPTRPDDLFSSAFCATMQDGRIGTILKVDDDELRVRIRADLCPVPITESAAGTVVDRLNAELVLPFGWRYLVDSAPQDVITPGLEVYMARYFDRVNSGFSARMSSPSVTGGGTAARPAAAGGGGGGGAQSAATGAGGGCIGTACPQSACTCDCAEFAVNGGAKLVHPGGAKLVHLTLCGTRCWGVVPVVHRRDPRCFV